jgi:outer membrane protein TolC
MRTTYLEHINLTVSDIERSAALLEQLLGWQVRWRAGLARLAGFDEALLPLAASRTQAALAAYRAGGATLKAVLDAQQAELSTQFDRVAVELDSASDWARLTTLIAPTESAR